MRSRRPSDGSFQCIYCGRLDPASFDHVPPRSLFAKPRPATLITVPSCLECNTGASQDDEYFRAMVTLRHDLDHPDAQAARDSTLRSLGRPQARGLLESLLATTQPVELRTPGGLYVGRSATYEPDAERLCRVARRVSLGLFYYETRRRLPDDYEARTYLPSAIDPSATGALARLRDVAVALRASGSPRFVGRRVLSYWWQPTREDANVSAWLLVFYERVPFVTITTPRVT